MIFDSIKPGVGEDEKELLNNYILIMLAIATSIDALAVGVSFAFLNISIVNSVIIIGLLTFFISYFGFFIGRKLGEKFASKIGIVNIIGGLILISIGIKILFEHLA
jgi:putative Mn2+ efflux pump MntP